MESQDHRLDPAPEKTYDDPGASIRTMGRQSLLVGQETAAKANGSGDSSQKSVPEVPGPPGARSVRVSVVIPALNEERNLPHAFANLPADVHEIVLVDGHSTDETVRVARELRHDVKVVVQAAHGKGNALAAGFAAATGDIIVSMDADGSTNAAEIPRFLQELLDGADYVKGSRYLRQGGSADLTRLRSLGNRLLGRLVNMLYRTRYTDLCYGYNAFWRHRLPQVAPECDGFEVETLMNIRAAKAGLVVREVPSYELRRVYGDSNLRAFTDGWRVLGTILGELSRRRPRADGQRIGTAK
jgi:glycosyltransferase involved in cell wall biosynthesis